MMNRNLIVFILYSLFWFAFLGYTGTLNSGYHFIDDHHVIAINESIGEKGFINTAETYLNEDLKVRFRPLYRLYMVALSHLYGMNFFAWSVHSCILAILSSYFLFLFIRRQGHTYLSAFLFPLLTLIGAQMSIWWRFGPAETIGFVCLSSSLYFLANSIYRRRYYQIIISILFLVMATLSKESFVLFIPAYLSIFLWFKFQCNANKSILNLIQQNLLPLISLILLLILELFIIKYSIGTNTVGYAGVDSSIEFINFFNYVFHYFIKSYYFYLIVLGLLILLFNFNSSFRISFKNEYLSTLTFNLIILFAIIFPQLILYYKSGIAERYLLPFLLGLSLFVYYLFKVIHDSSKINSLFKKLYLISIAIVIFMLLKKDAYPNARDFAIEGKATNKLLTAITDNTQTNDSILVVLSSFENFEFGYSIHEYLKTHRNRNNIYFYKVNLHKDYDFAVRLDGAFTDIFSNKIVNQIDNNYSCIAIFPFMGNTEVKKKLNNTEFYQNQEIGPFTLYLKN